MNDARAFITVIVIGLALFFAGVRLNDASGRAPFFAANGSDFREFYCAGEAVLHHVDPYRVEPLRSCIRRVEPRTDPVWLVTPAPLPGYALLLSAAFATLPFDVARIVWEALLVASVFAAAFALARLIGWSPLVVALVLIPTDGLLNLAYGELPPMVIAALCIGALALERGSVMIPAFCAGISLIEPHVGLPALIALLVAVPRARVWAATVVATLIVVSLAAIGLGPNIEYFRFVLPLQALAEVAANDQYSLTRVVAVLGASPATAVAIGSASYAVMAAVGVTFAVKLGHNRRLAYVFLLPPAAVALGGSYIHDVQIAAAIPLALLLAADAPAFRPWAFGATVMLLLPATSHRLAAFPVPACFALVALVVLGWILAERRPISQRVAIFASGAAIVGVVGIWLLSGSHNGSVDVARLPPRIAAPGISARAYAPEVWGAYLRVNGESSKPTPRYLVEKIPAWFALSILIFCAVCAVKLRDDVNPRGIR